MDQERWMDVLACHGGLAVLETYLGHNHSDSEDENGDRSLFQLMKKKPGEIGQPLSTIEPLPNSLLEPDSLTAMPPEMYRRRLTKLKRRQLFFKQLKRRDILYLQVVNYNDESFKCLVLAKHGDLMQLDDLSLVMHFPKLKPEMETLNAELEKFDLLRGAFWSCNVWERKLFVTLDTLIFTEEEKVQIPKLGKITRRDLPYYVGCKKIGMTYAGYVQRSAGYREEGYCMKQLRECLGIDTKRIYSFYKEWNCKSYAKAETYAELRKKVEPDPSTKRLLKSFEYFRAGNMFKALHYANRAIMFNPDNIQARVTRGTVYANLGQMKKAFIDTEDSLKLDQNHESARKQMSELLVAASKTHLIGGNYFKWHESLVLAKTYNPNNREAQELLAKAKYETSTPEGANAVPVKILIPPSMTDVYPIYRRLFPQGDKRRLLKQFKKQRKRQQKHDRHRRERQRAQRAEEPQPIPTTSTSRRQVFLRPNSPVFRRPFPPRSINMRP